MPRSRGIGGFSAILFFSIFQPDHRMSVFSLERSVPKGVHAFPIRLETLLFMVLDEFSGIGITPLCLGGQPPPITVAIFLPKGTYYSQ
jgi:hypothetical protein